MRRSTPAARLTAAALAVGLASGLGVSAAAQAATPPSPLPESTAGATATVESAEQQLANAEHQVASATEQAQRLTYAVITLHVRQDEAQAALSDARAEARLAIRSAYDIAATDPTTTLFAVLSGNDPNLADAVRHRRVSDASAQTRKLAQATRRLAAISTDLNRRRTEAVRAAALAVGAASKARIGLAAAELRADEVRAQLQQQAQRDELNRLSEQLKRSLAALAAATPHPAAGSAGSVTLVADSPAELRSLYSRAAATCPGLPWGVLAAIGQVETDHGRNKAVSSAGAMGPMQFLPETFAAFAVDGDGDGKTDILNQADAVFSAAHYLCSNGAGRSETLYDAIFAYNHSDYYVNTVLQLAAQYQ